MLNPTNITSFHVKDCSLIALAQGEKAHTLCELRDKITTINLECIYYHFWGERIRPHLAHSEFINDFATWAQQSLRDLSLAEQLGIIDPTDYDSLGELRQEVFEVLDKCCEEKDHKAWQLGDYPFYFISSKIVVFETSYQIHHPSHLVEVISHMSLGSIFYHFIDAKRRTSEGIDDFSHWLKGFGEGYQDLIHQIEGIDIYFLSLSELKEELKNKINYYFTKKIIQ